MTLEEALRPAGGYKYEGDEEEENVLEKKKKQQAKNKRAALFGDSDDEWLG